MRGRIQLSISLGLVLLMLALPTIVAVGQQAAPPPRPLSAEAQQAITLRDFQTLAQDYVAEATARKTAEDALAEARATIAAQQLKLSWWAKYAAGLKAHQR